MSARALAPFLVALTCACSSGTGSPGDASTDAPAQDPRCATASCASPCDAVGLVCYQKPSPCQSNVTLTCTPSDAGSGADASSDAGLSAAWTCTPCGV